MYLDRDEMLAVLNALPDPVFVLTESGLYAGLFGRVDPNGADHVTSYPTRASMDAPGK